jgi:hypothetical protein
MLRFGLGSSLIGCLALLAAMPVLAEPSSEGHPHKWETVQKGMPEFLNDGFDLKAVVYDTAELGVKPDILPDVHYFLQKKALLVRCDFRKRGEVSTYWCAQLTKPHGQ